MPTQTKDSPVASSVKKIIATQVGVVESDKRNKSRTVVVRYKAMHPKYGKFVSRKTVLQVHDENNESRLGDTVEVKPCRPMSKTKKWALSRIVERGSRVELVQTDTKKLIDGEETPVAGAKPGVKAPVKPGTAGNKPAAGKPGAKPAAKPAAKKK